MAKASLCFICASRSAVAHDVSLKPQTLGALSCLSACSLLFSDLMIPKIAPLWNSGTLVHAHCESSSQEAAQLSLAGMPWLSPVLSCLFVCIRELGIALGLMVRLVVLTRAIAYVPLYMLKTSSMPGVSRVSGPWQVPRASGRHLGLQECAPFSV